MMSTTYPLHEVPFDGKLINIRFYCPNSPEIACNTAGSMVTLGTTDMHVGGFLLGSQVVVGHKPNSVTFYTTPTKRRHGGVRKIDKKRDLYYGGIGPWIIERSHGYSMKEKL